MNSEETLAMPGSEPAHIRLILTPDNVRNTTITLDHGGATLYTVRSAKDFSSTAIIDAKGDEVAKIKYRSLLPDTFTLRGAERKLKDWLPERKRLCVTWRLPDLPNSYASFLQPCDYECFGSKEICL